MAVTFKEKLAKHKRDIILLVRDENVSEEIIDRQVEKLNTLMGAVETVTAFCQAHELVRRNRITNKPRKIILAVKEESLKPFWFLLNKN